MVLNILKYIKHFKQLDFKHIFKTQLPDILVISVLIVVLVITNVNLLNNVNSYKRSNSDLTNKLKVTAGKLNDLQNQDQYKINQQLKKNITNIQSLSKDVVDIYQNILDLKVQKQDTSDLDKQLAQGINYISEINYPSASAQLNSLADSVKKKQDELAKAQAAASAPAQNVTKSNTPPTNGFSVQSVSANGADFTVYIIAADLNSTKVIVDTASDGDCGNNCPVMPLADYVARSGAYAGINGSYFCPAEYPSCVGKTNSFDLLVMNKNKTYFNSSNNVYSTNPAVIFYGNNARFVSQALSWGRDTSVDSVLSNYPLLVNNGNVVYSGGGDAKYAPKAARTFVANKGNTAYMGIVFNATMQESANVLKALGMDNAMNLDQGGSTALWYGGGYKAGPGRNIPNALLFVRK